MNIDQLTVFKEIHNQRTLRGAAHKLHKTQPALSASLKQLESHLGFKLFDRSTYRPTLTPQGINFLKGVDGLLQEFDSLNELADHIRGGHESTLILAIDSACPLKWLIPKLQLCLNSFPRLEFDLRFGVLTQSVDLLLEGTAQLALSPLFQPHPELDSRPIFHQRLIPAIHRSLLDASDSTKNTVPHSLLKKIPNIAVQTNKNLQLGTSGLRGGQCMYVSNHAIKEELVLLGMGWGRVIESRLSENPDLIMITHREIPQLELKLELIWRKNHALGAAARKLRDDLLQDR